MISLVISLSYRSKGCWSWSWSSRTDGLCTKTRDRAYSPWRCVFVVLRDHVGVPTQTWTTSSSDSAPWSSNRLKAITCPAPNHGIAEALCVLHDALLIHISVWLQKIDFGVCMWKTWWFVSVTYITLHLIIRYLDCTIGVCLDKHHY